MDTPLFNHEINKQKPFKIVLREVFDEDASEAGQYNHFQRLVLWKVHRETNRSGIGGEKLHSRA